MHHAMIIQWKRHEFDSYGVRKGASLGRVFFVFIVSSSILYNTFIGMPMILLLVT